MFIYVCECMLDRLIGVVISMHSGLYVSRTSHTPNDDALFSHIIIHFSIFITFVFYLNNKQKKQFIGLG